MHVNVTVTVIVVLYMLFMLYIGWASSKRIKSNSDFMVAGRRLGPILMAGTLTATGSAADPLWALSRTVCPDTA